MKWTFLAACLPVLLCAQMPRAGVWWEGKVAQDLNLTEVQQKQIASLRREYSRKIFDLNEVLHKAEGDLEIAFDETRVDQQKSNELIEHLVSARAEVFRATSQFELKLRTVLTADQWREVKKRAPRGPGRGPDGWRRGSPPPKGQPTAGQSNP